MQHPTLKPIITKPGTYRARTGRTVEILQIGSDGRCHGQYISKTIGGTARRDWKTWDQYGRLSRQGEHPWDVVGRG